MAKKLTKKQAELLSQFTHDELLAIINAMLEDNSEAVQYLSFNYLMSPEDKLKNAEKEYKKQQRKRGGYDYWKSHEFFVELEKTVAQPLNQLALILPDDIIPFTTQLILDFDHLSNKYDTSSGHWQEYIYGLLTAWLTALGAVFKNNPDFDVVSPYLDMKAKCDYFPAHFLQRNKMHFPPAAIQMIRDKLLGAGDVEQALDLSFVLKDFSYLNAAYAQNRFADKAACLRYASILFDDFQTEQTVKVLQEIQLEPMPSSIQSQVNALLVQALYENGDTQQALDLCKTYFSKRLDVEYFKKYLKYHPSASSDQIEVFYQIAYDRGAADYLNFAAEMQNWAAFDQLVREKVADADYTWLQQLDAIQSISNIRKWSTTLAQHGLPISAICIRRRLVESNLTQAKSTYYKYAVSDLKKSIDFTGMVKDEDQNLIPSTADFIESLYAQHGRKYSFWEECASVISSQYLR